MTDVFGAARLYIRCAHRRDRRHLSFHTYIIIYIYVGIYLPVILRYYMNVNACARLPRASVRVRVRARAVRVPPGGGGGEIIFSRIACPKGRGVVNDACCTIRALEIPVCARRKPASLSQRSRPRGARPHVVFRASSTH